MARGGSSFEIPAHAGLELTVEVVLFKQAFLGVHLSNRRCHQILDAITIVALDLDVDATLLMRMQFLLQSWHHFIYVRQIILRILVMRQSLQRNILRYQILGVQQILIDQLARHEYILITFIQRLLILLVILF